MDRLKILISILIIGGCWTVSSARAQIVPEPHQLKLLGPVGVVRIGETFTVEVRIDSIGEVINAAELYLNYNPQQLTLTQISRAQSAFTLWPEEPRDDSTTGQVSLVGGRPGGLVSVDGTIATLSFHATQTGDAVLTADRQRSGVYLHDGAGTRRAVSVQPATITINDSLIDLINLTSTTHPTPDSWSRQNRIEVDWSTQTGGRYSYQLSTDRQAVPDNIPEDISGAVIYNDLADGIYYFTIIELRSGVWSAVIQRRFLIDTTVPESLTITSPDPSTIEGRHLLVWVAQDNLSGVVRAELRVGSRNIGAVTSPLEIKPNWFGHQATLTVYDAAGNSRSESYQLPGRSWSDWLLLWWPAAAAIIVIGGILIFWRRRCHRRR